MLELKQYQEQVLDRLADRMDQLVHRDAVAHATREIASAFAELERELAHT